MRKALILMILAIICCKNIEIKDIDFIIPNKNEFYFPFNENNNIKIENSLSKFTNKWYSENLQSMNEPIIYNLKEKNIEIYRLTILPTFDKPFTYRISKYNNKINIIFKETNGTGGYETGKLIENKIKLVKEKNWRNLESKLSKIDFWKMKTFSDSMKIKDGSEWILEGYKNGNYHFVTRTSPDAYQFNEIDKEFGFFLNYFKKFSKTTQKH